MLVVDAIARVGNGDGCSVGDVAEAVTVAHSTASRLVDRAVRAGMVTRTRDAAEARRAVLRLTPAGERLQASATEFRQRQLAEVTSGWSAGDVTVLSTLLQRFASDAQPRLAAPYDLSDD